MHCKIIEEPVPDSCYNLFLYIRIEFESLILNPCLKLHAKNVHRSNV
jgi:hypothetical protein